MTPKENSLVPKENCMASKENCMTQDQFDRESNFRIAFSVFKQLFASSLITAEQLAAAKEKLVERFQPPIGRLTDVLAVR